MLRGTVVENEVIPRRDFENITEVKKLVDVMASGTPAETSAGSQIALPTKTGHGNPQGAGRCICRTGSRR